MMRKFIILLVFIVLLIAPTAVIHAQDDGGISVTCPNGFTIENGVEMFVNIRSGFSYTATAVGINGFDPVMAVVVRGEVQGCSDDNSDASEYSFNLPTTGAVNASSLSSQLTFSHSFSGFEDVSIVVADLSGNDGEFALFIEGLGVTAADGSGPMGGDPFTTFLTENMVNADINLSVYMIGTERSLDPYLSLVSTQTEEQVLSCDDAGSTTCGGERLNNYVISRGSNRNDIVGDELDAYLTVPTTQLTDIELPAFLSFRMTSLEQRTTGSYIVVFHYGIGSSNEGRSGGDTTTVDPTPVPDTDDRQVVDSDGGVNVTCPDGTQIIGGVEFVINVRPGFSYTATALGVDGFDPVMAVLVEGNIQDCNDDSADAGEYFAVLPTTGDVASSRLNSQLPYSNPLSDFANVSIVVGGFAGQAGEFILVLEGMAVTAQDGQGDPFIVSINSNMVNSGVDLAAYMIGVGNSLDPYMSVVSADGTEELFVCDDGGSFNCDNGVSVEDFGVARSENQASVVGDTFDAMILLSTSNLSDVVPGETLSLPFLMSSYQQTSTGDYLVIFHAGVGSATGTGGNGGGDL